MVKRAGLNKFFQTDISKLYKPRLFVEEKRQLQIVGQKKALKLFHKAAKRIPAYRDFLHKNNIKPRSIKTYKDFIRLPHIDKKNYIDYYSLKERSCDGELAGLHMVSASSGTTGKPYFWPRDLSQEIDGAIIHELIFKEIFQLDKNPSLLIIGFAMGNWIAGTFTLACANLVAWKDYPLMISTPGYDQEEILRMVEKFSANFKQIIITGHAPLLKAVVESGVKRGIDWRKLETKFLGAGMGISEEWRSYILKTARLSSYFKTFINIYGSADTALMAFETPISILTRKLIAKKRKLNRDFFADNKLPSLYQFDPRVSYFEENNGELIISVDAGTPLVRYNIHDEGGIISNRDMFHLFEKAKIDLEKELIKHKLVKYNWGLPFVYLFGRPKLMAKIYGANVYNENVKHVLEDNKIHPFVSGEFILSTKEDKNHDPYLVLDVELVKSRQPDKRLKNLIQEIFVTKTRRINNEYDVVYNKFKNKVVPKIILHQFGDKKYFPKGVVRKSS